MQKHPPTPAWASTEVYGHTTGEHLTLVFTVSEDCPSELFPLEVLVSTDILDVRHESGLQLPVRLADETGKFYGETGLSDYKYVFTVDSPGSQRIYFENILPQSGGMSNIVMLVNSMILQTKAKMELLSAEAKLNTSSTSYVN